MLYVLAYLKMFIIVPLISKNNLNIINTKYTVQSLKSGIIGTLLSQNMNQKYYFSNKKNIFTTEKGKI